MSQVKRLEKLAFRLAFRISRTLGYNCIKEVFMYREDYLLRQIENFFKFLKKLLKIYRPNYSYISKSMEELDRSLGSLVDLSRVNEAEDLLFENFSSVDEYLIVTINFYERLNSMTDEELEGLDFSRQELLEGLEDISRRLKLPIDLFLEK